MSGSFTVPVERPCAKCCNQHVCLYVCLLVYLISHMSRSHNFMCMLTLAVAQSFSDDRAICYVFLVVWICHVLSRNGASGPES